MTGAEGASARDGEVAHEPDQLPAGTTLKVFCGTVSIGLLLCIVAFLALRARERSLGVSSLREPALPAQLGAAHLRDDLFSIERAPAPAGEAGREELGRYRWVDRAHRRVAIPIDVAVELVARDQLGRGAR
jgi:hypothetical protein